MMERAIIGVVIDAAHGGEDAGNMGNGIVEKDLSLQISQYMYRRLQELGVPVTLVRNSDETISNEERIRRILAPYGEGSNVIVISNHMNAGGADGAEVIYALRNNSTLADQIAQEIELAGQNVIRNNSTLADQIAQEIELAGQNVIKVYQRRLPSDTSKDYYFIHRDTGNTQPIMIEYGYVDSNQDDPEQLKNNYVRYAEAVVKAITTYIGKSYVPELDENSYVVKSGDSLWSIANRYGITVDQLKVANGLTNNLLQVGQVLTIPKQSTESPSESNNIYIVKAGDSLWSIANRYGTTVAILKQLNGLSSDNLSIGQKLYLPNQGSVEKPDNVTYVVKSGDSLYTIARKYNTTVNDLMTLNNLKTSLLSIGQILKIPNSSVGTVYVVKSGDSLWSIANRYGTTVDAIKQKNGLTSNNLSIGQVLYI